MNFKIKKIKNILFYDKEENKFYNGNITFNPEENIFFKIEIKDKNDKKLDFLRK